MSEAVVMHLLNEVAQHLLGHVEIGDDAILERADRGDRPRRPPKHALGLDPHGVDFAGALVDGNDRWFREDDAATANVDERVRRPEIDCHLASAEAA